MGFGSLEFGSSPFGSSEVGTDILTIVKKFPTPDSVENDPDVYVAASIRSSETPVLVYEVYIDGVLALDQDGFQEGFSGTVVGNGFLGFDFTVRPDVEFDLDAETAHDVRVTAENFDDEAEEEWSFFVREPCYDNVRFAMPKETQRRDEQMMSWLKIWDGILCHVTCKTVDKFRDRGLFDVDRIPEEALPAAFEDAGLIYPDFDEISVARKRRILKNADRIHQTRYSLAGLQFYISLLVDATVSVAKLNQGFFIFYNSATFGFPTPTMMNSCQTDDDFCTYYIGLRDNDIEITITGNLSDEMKAFLTETIFREVPMSDDPVNPREINLIFVPV